MNRVVEAAAARAVEAAAERLAVALRDVPGVRVTRVAGGVEVSGRGVADEPALRWPAGLLR